MTAQKYHPPQGLISIEIVNDFELIPESLDNNDGEAFNYAWVGSLINNVSQRVKDQYCSTGKEAHWLAFKSRILSPILEDVPSPSISEICSLYNIENEIKASNMISSVKRTFQKALRNHIREYVDSEQDVDSELSELARFLAKYVQD